MVFSRTEHRATQHFFKSFRQETWFGHNSFLTDTASFQSRHEFFCAVSTFNLTSEVNIRRERWGTVLMCHTTTQLCVITPKSFYQRKPTIRKKRTKQNKYVKLMTQKKRCPIGGVFKSVNMLSTFQNVV